MDDLKNHTLATMGLPTNEEGFRAFVGLFYAAFSGPQLLPQKVLCCADLVALLGQIGAMV